MATIKSNKVLDEKTIKEILKEWAKSKLKENQEQAQGESRAA